jgi:hypothetical protein
MRIDYYVDRAFPIVKRFPLFHGTRVPGGGAVHSINSRHSAIVKGPQGGQAGSKRRARGALRSQQLFSRDQDRRGPDRRY